MRVLAIGDINGEKAMEKLEEELGKIKKEKNIKFVIANGENASNGNGLTKVLYERILNYGIDIITMGNHTWGEPEILSFIEDSFMIRPANYSKGLPGKGYIIYKRENIRIGIINLIGKRYLDEVYCSDNPFSVIEEIIKEIKEQVDIIIVDFHATSTAEKFMMGYFLDGKVSVVYGTHTHVQTADEKIMPNGTGFITDIGMTGPNCSSLGSDPSTILPFYYNCAIKVEEKISKNECMMNGCIFDIDESTGKTIHIERLQQY